MGKKIVSWRKFAVLNTLANMKVYLVISIDAQEGDRLFHIASTMDKARSWLDRNPQYEGSPWYAEIVECDVDDEKLFD